MISDSEAHPSTQLWTGSLHLLKAGIGAIKKWVAASALTDPEAVLYAAWISVWGRWFIWLVAAFQMAYRPGFWYPQNIEFLVPHVLLLSTNSLVHYRLLTHKPVTWRWMIFLCTVDMALITANVVIGGGFSSFIFLAYYPALAVFAVVFSSSWLSLAWTTTAAVAYAVVCLMVGSDLDLDARKEKVVRLAAMYFIALGISLITRFERIRWRTAVASERQLRQERVELSQTIHDTTAQTAYMIGLGIHRARNLADESNEELQAALDATLELVMSAMWEMRGPIDKGRIIEGNGLGRVLRSHCATFERITSVHTEISQSGAEPPLAMETRTHLFSIAHNALTNAFLHARPSKVEVRLIFEADHIRLSVSDDGLGLPDGYAERGLGFNGMTADAEHMGGNLIVESVEGGGGTTITCVVPHEAGVRGVSGVGGVFGRV